MTRILFVTQDYPPNIKGGPAISCSLLVKGLRERGLSVDVLAVCAGTDEVTDVGSTTYIGETPTQLWRNVRSYRQMVRSSSRYDLVHVMNNDQMPAAIRYARKTGAKIIATLSDHDAICTNTGLISECCGICDPLSSLRCILKKPASSFGSIGLPSSISKLYPPIHWAQHSLLKRGMKSADAYIGLSKYSHGLYTLAGYPAERIFIVPEMIDPSMSEGNAPPRGNDRTVFLYVGRVEAEKGIDTLLHAFSRLEQRETSLVVVGKGNELEDLKRLSEILGIADRVEFTGFVKPSELRNYYESADVFVQPSRCAETFGRTALDALWFGVPAIVSDRGALAEVVGNGGLTFHAGDIEDLRSKMELLLQDPTLRQRIGENGRQIVCKNSAENIVGQTIRVYEKCLKS